MAQAASGAWLFKEEPESYSFADLERDGSAIWDGITNNLALKNLRSVKPGDRVLFYHTGKERAVIGEMRVIEGPKADPSDPKLVAVKVEAVKRWPRPITLNEIKSDAQLAGWDLVRLPRLSVVPVTPEQWKRLAEMSRSSE